MKKYYKILLSLMIVSSLSMIGAVNATTTNTSGSPVMKWGVSVGDINEFTVGWNLNLTLPDFLWNAITSNVTDALGYYVNAKTAYSDFNKLPDLFNLKATVTNITNQGSYYTDPNPEYDYSYANDFVYNSLQLKYPDQNATYYKDAPLFLMNLMSQYNSSVFNNYNGLFAQITGEQNFFGQLYAELSSITTTQESIPVSVWNTPSQYDNTTSPEMFSLYIPENFDFHTLLNFTSINSEFNQSYTDPNTNIQYSNMWSYMQATMNLPVYVNSFTSLLTTCGVTNLTIGSKNVYAHFDFGSISQNFLNGFLKEYFNNSYMSAPFNDIVNFDQFLTTMGNQLNMTISTPVLTATEGLTYNNNGLLQNAHVQFSISAKINNQPVSFSPVFDVSSGDHTSIGANWNNGNNSTTNNSTSNSKPSIPGYPIVTIGIASMLGVFAVIAIMEKKRK